MAFGDGYGQSEVRNFPMDIAISGSSNIYTFNNLQMARGAMKV
jgi:hypothetical protein